MADMPEIVQAQCPGCKNILRISPQWLQQPMRCNHCQMVFQARPNSLAAEAPAFPAAGDGGFIPHQEARRPAYELWLAMIAVLGITALYVFVVRSGISNKSSSLLGHGLGVVGFLMMLSTETLYTLRKRLRRFTLGQMSTWLQWHIFTGIVGPYLVLLHSAGKFHGLAGVVTWLTVLMVISGFVGRYIYTAAPRTLDGLEVGVQELEQQVALTDRRLQALSEPARQALATEAPPRGWLVVLARPWLRWRQRRRLRRALQHLSAAERSHAAQLEALLAERYRLEQQIHSLAATRRLLALWHVLHVPLGGVLFSLAFIHIGAALYYATFLK